VDSPTQDPPRRGTVWGMAATLSDLLDAQGGVVTTAQLDDLTADRAHRRSLQRSLRRVLHRAYARREDDRALLSAYAAVLVVPEVVLRGRSALQVLEVDVLRRPARLEVYVPPTADASDWPELAVRRTTLEAPEQLRVAGLPITSPARTAVDLARELPPADGLAVLDAVLHAALCGRDDLVAALVPGARGVRRARTLIVLASHLAESPQESRLRWWLLAAGLPAPVPQYAIRDGHGVLLARVDLAYPEVRLAIEYDGVVFHTDARALARDRERLNALTAAGWSVLRFTARDLHTPRTAALVRQELARLSRGQVLRPAA